MKLYINIATPAHRVIVNGDAYEVISGAMKGSKFKDGAIRWEKIRKSIGDYRISTMKSYIQCL